MPAKAAPLALNQLEQTIHLLRGQRVLLDRDLAVLYGVETGALNRAVRRNKDRFPSDFMFELTREEAERSRCQFGILNAKRRGQNLKYRPLAFTEQGVAMLSSVLNSPRAIQVIVQKTHHVNRVNPVEFPFPQFSRLRFAVPSVLSASSAVPPSL